MSSGKRDRQKARAAKKAVGRGKSLPKPYPPLTEPCVYEPLPRKWTQSGVVEVADSAVVRLTHLILTFASWPHGVEDPPPTPYREPAAPKPTKGKRLRKGQGRKQPLDMVCAAVEQQVTAEAKKSDFAVQSWFTPELHDAIERVHHAVMQHNIAASQSAFQHALKLGKHPHRHNAEDLSQRTKETILQGLASLEPWLVPNALMCATCKNLFLNDVKGRAHEAEDAKGYVVASFAVPPDQDRREESVEDWVNATDLAPHLKRVLVLRAANTPGVEIAKHFGCPVGTVYSWISRAREQLKEWMQKHPRSPSVDDMPRLPMGVRSGQWEEPASVGRRGFNPAGFDGLPSEQLDGKIPRGVDAERWKPSKTSFCSGLRASDGRYLPKTSDPGRRIPVTPGLNAYYKERLKFAHWRNLAHGKGSACYFECGCEAEQPCPEWLVKYEHRPYRQDKLRKFPRHPDYVGTRLPRQIREEPDVEDPDVKVWVIVGMFGPRYRCGECRCFIVPLKNCTDCIRCGKPAAFPPTPVVGVPYPPLPVLSLPSTRVQLHPKPSWRHRITSAWVKEYTPEVRSNLGALSDGEAPLMDTIEKDRELPEVFREWKLVADGGELGS